ncbi:MAG: SRPBCC family protein [Solirubrobacterales bacterium]|nr:SRPBCC family protein [Solirubrobacterales bacterium]
MPSLQPVDESYFQTAQQRFEHTWVINRPASEVWQEISGEKPLHWVTGLDITWTSPVPRGVGATRTAKVLGLVQIQERFFIWEEGRRFSFYVEQANVPVFTSFAEDYLVEPEGSDRSRFTWRMAVTPSPLGKPGAPVNKLVAALAFRDTGRYFKAG